MQMIKTFQAGRFALLLLLLILSVPQVFADRVLADDANSPSATDVAAIVEPSDPKGKAAFDVLQKHCARCHQAGPLLTRSKPAGNFGNVLRLDEIASDTRFILPGNPDASQLIVRMADPARADMPKDVKDAEAAFEDPPFPVPTVEEMSVLRDWVTSLGETAVAGCDQSGMIDNPALVQILANDLNTLPDHRVRGTRYVTLTHLHNACVPDKKMAVYRQAVVKLLNSLSHNPDVLKLQTVDAARTVIRFHLADLKWSEDDWARILKPYPYASRPDTNLFAFLQTSTGTSLPYVRGDWLVFSASRPPLYHDLLRLPKTFDGLQQQLGVDIEANLRDFLAQRAGFQNSGVSQNNRLIERHTISTGVFWTSYDFAGNRDRQSLFEFPLGPSGENGFDHDGGETIFSLPNGFHAYYLNTADGERLDRGPTEIVRDPERKDFAVTNGISCLGCHDQGIRHNTDDVRAHVMATRTFSKQMRDTVAALYPEAAELKRLLDQDQRAWAAAMRRADLDPLLKLNGIEMINALSDQYEQDLKLRSAAAEFGLDEAAFLDAVGAVGGAAFSLRRRLEQGLVPRDHFEDIYARIVHQVTEEDMMPAPGDSDNHDEDDNALSTPPIPAPRPGAHDRIASGSFHLTLFSDKSVYRRNQAAVFTVKSEVGCYLTLINVDGSGKATVIFPNRFQQENFLPANKTLHVPDASAGFEFRLQDQGTETVVALCSESPDPARGITHDFARHAFTPLGDYRSFVSRQITVVEAPMAETPAEVMTPDGRPTLAARTSIKFKVK